MNRRLHLIGSVTACVLLGACASNAAPGTGGSATMAERLETANMLAAEEFGHDRFVCEPEYLTGSKIPKIVCMTNAQRQQRAEANRAAVDDYYNNSSGKGCVTNC